MRKFWIMIVAAFLTIAAIPGEAQEATQPPVETNPAVEFLKKVEAKNKDLQTLYGKFKQVRVNPMFLEEIHSSGEFWYTKPDKFRCDYYEPSDARFYLLGDVGMYYTPELKQVEKYRLETGDSAPINQMLVGFGLNTDKILEVFNVRVSDEQPKDEKLLKIDFISRDTSRTMDYKQITVTFDREKIEPRVLEMDEEEDTVRVTLEKVEVNAKIAKDKYEANFPKDVEIIELNSL